MEIFKEQSVDKFWLWRRIIGNVVMHHYGRSGILTLDVRYSRVPGLWPVCEVRQILGDWVPQIGALFAGRDTFLCRQCSLRLFPAGRSRWHKSADKLPWSPRGSYSVPNQETREP